MKQNDYQRPMIKFATSGGVEALLDDVSASISENSYSGIAGARGTEEVYDNATDELSPNKNIWE